MCTARWNWMRDEALDGLNALASWTGKLEHCQQPGGLDWLQCQRHGCRKGRDPEA
jgi:hypothetical protein